MKDLILINSSLPVNFWDEVIDTANYLHNRLSTKQDDPTIILEYMHIFGSRVSTFILTQKHLKSDIQKTWKGILISYTRMSKTLKTWAPCIYQVCIASEPIVNKGKRGANLFREHLLLPAE